MQQYIVVRLILTLPDKAFTPVAAALPIIFEAGSGGKDNDHVKHTMKELSQAKLQTIDATDALSL